MLLKCVDLSDNFTITKLTHVFKFEFFIFSGDWPWISALGYGIRKDHKTSIKWLCGGTLISTRHVITAGHCVYNRQDLILVRLGDLNLFSDSDSAYPIDVDIERRTIHPNYSATTYTNDIAILRMKEDILFTSKIRTEKNSQVFANTISKHAFS